MQKKSKYLIMVVAFPTILWILIGFWYFFSIQSETISILDIPLLEGNIPFWFILIIIMIGYWLSIGIGYAMFIEKKYWKEF